MKLVDVLNGIDNMVLFSHFHLHYSYLPITILIMLFQIVLLLLSHLDQIYLSLVTLSLIDMHLLLHYHMLYPFPYLHLEMYNLLMCPVSSLNYWSHNLTTSSPSQSPASMLIVDSCPYQNWRSDFFSFFWVLKFIWFFAGICYKTVI